MRSKKSILLFLLGLISFFIYDIGFKAYSQAVKKNQSEIKKEDSYTRPEPSRPIKPEIPNVNRYQQDKIFLEYADSLFKTRSRDTIERQILKGNVKFRQAGMWMYCDSAYYFPQFNSLDAFGNVRMEQGDTLFVYADKLYYQGDNRLAKLKNGLSEPKVRLINKDVTLTTDSLDYDLANEWGWYIKWGTIDDKVNTLTSLEGFYSPNSKEAEFYSDVVLVNNEDGYKLLTDTLFYNTNTHIAKIESLTTIESANDTIVTNRAIYDTNLGNADLLSRSMIIHRDSTGNITTLEGDSIIYDKKTRISKAYMFKDPSKRSMPMVLTDTTQKTTLIGGFGIYNDSTKEAMAYIYPLLMEYSRGDTLFLRADTIKTYIITEMIDAPPEKKIINSPKHDGKDLVVIDSLSITIDTLYFNVSLPWGDSPLRSLNEAVLNNRNKDAEISDVILADSTVSESPFDITLETGIDEDLGREEEEIIDIISSDIILKEDDEKEVNVTKEKIEAVKDTVKKIPKDFHVALAYYNSRFFKKDIQGVADSIIVIEKDSMMYMFRKPIIWSGERQVTGNRIDVHFNDSTADWAKLPESGLMSEHIDEDFYNQISGKNLFATFRDQTLKTMEVSGNVETIFLPQEADSTFNRMVSAESSYLSLEMDNGKMEKLKMWPEVSGTVTPIFMVKKSQQFLKNFHWWESLRPKREWYGGNIVWADDLGEVPEILEKYFESPSDFGEPKSFSGPRFIPPSSSLRDWDNEVAIDVDQLKEETLEEIENNENFLDKEETEAIKEGENIENVEEENADNTSDLEEENY